MTKIVILGIAFAVTELTVSKDMQIRFGNGNKKAKSQTYAGNNPYFIGFGKGWSHKIANRSDPFIHSN